jgi:serum/glucocorticoid-regulated kinase 2
VLLNESGYAVLADFGYAKNICEAEDDSRGEAKPTFTFCGTLHCMAPEVLQRKGHGFKADWWSLGIFVYEMMTGRPPWGYGVGGVEREQLERDIVSGEVAFEDGIFEGVGRSGRAFIEKLLVREEEGRMGSLEEFQGETFFETGEWKEKEGGGEGGEGGASYIEIGGEPPEFNREIGDLDVLEDLSGDAGGSEAFGNAFDGF